ncbi:MAG TPA: hypothetical protein VHT52_04185 [Stellaceae bacterium]|nr:hypothetical protein [Stellaceae bacterium]
MVAHVRRCGSCSLCCRLLPVRSVGKGANERCKHQRFSSKGECCKVYVNLWRVSPECKLWSCGWLKMPDTGELSRPDKSHYVIDPMPEYITVRDADGAPEHVQVVQIWCDESYPDAHRDPALRAWLVKRNMPGLVRYDNKRGLVIFPPSYMSHGEWTEKHSNMNAEQPHTFEQVVQALGGANVR